LALKIIHLELLLNRNTMKNVFKSRLKEILRFMTKRPNGGTKPKDFKPTYESLGRVMHDNIGKHSETKE